MVDAVVGGVPTRLILDTGSTDHVLSRDLLERVGAPMRRADAGTDHAGAPVASWTVGDLGIDIGGRSFDLHDVVGIEAPAAFAGWNVGGFLSPQHLDPEVRVFLDLADERFVLVADTAPGAVDAWLSGRVPALRAVALLRVPNEATVAVPASIEPFATVATMLNTGGRGTEFATAVVPGLANAEDRHGSSGISGAPVMGVDVGPRTLVAGDVRVPVPRLIVRREIDGPQGIVGMDVLLGTALAFSADPGRGVTWFVPASFASAAFADPAASGVAGGGSGVVGGRSGWVRPTAGPAPYSPRLAFIAIGIVVAGLVALLVAGLALEGALRGLVSAPIPSQAVSDDRGRWLTPEDLAVAFETRRWGDEALTVERAGDIELPTGRVVASDPFFVPDAAPFAEVLPPGSHPVDLLLVPELGDGSVAAARLAVQGATPVRWRAASLVGAASTQPAADPPAYAVDSGSGSFTSAEGAAFAATSPTFADDLLRALELAGRTSYRADVPLASGTGAALDIVVFASGYGDGGFGTWVGLDEAGRAVAFVTDFGVLSPLEAPGPGRSSAASARPSG